ncbi:MAG: NADH-quinone oxidoreductase subunit N [Phycisphaeraceae bacterium]
MNPFLQKLALISPEIAMAIGAALCLFLGLAPSAAVRRTTVWVAAGTLTAAGVLVLRKVTSDFEFFSFDVILSGLTLASYIKLAVVGVGLLLLMVAAQLPGQLPQIRAAEAAPRFDPSLVFRGEFFAFFLLSLTGVMLTAGADDLVWLFLALELTSLPTYIMVATSRARPGAQEAAVKYFFLGALAVAVFLYGFTLIYGATGFTDFAGIHRHVAIHGMSTLMLTGVVLALVGVAFKIAAFPMHFYVADVYQGAATPVTAFLAFVPKTAGFVAIVLILRLVADAAGQIPDPIMWLLWIMAVLTMTIGNTLGMMQTSVKRVLAYSSIAHSGYMLVGLIAGVGATGQTLGSGLAAVLFYLVAYGLANLAAFAVLGCLRTNRAGTPSSPVSSGDEADSFDDIAGLSRRHPGLAAIMLVALLSLIGLPPMVGFLGKIYIFGSVLAHSGDQPAFVWLVVIAVLNSAVSAVYYLKIAAACYFGQPQPGAQGAPAEGIAAIRVPSRIAGATLAALAAIILGVAGGPLVDAAYSAAGAAMRATYTDAQPAAQPDTTSTALLP